MDALIIVGVGIFVIVFLVVVFIATMKVLNPRFLDRFFEDLSWGSIICGVIAPFIMFSLNLHSFIEKIAPNSPNIINELNKQDLIFTIIFLVLLAANLLLRRRS